MFDDATKAPSDDRNMEEFDEALQQGCNTVFWTQTPLCKKR
jgi:hypothetical protein